MIKNWILKLAKSTNNKITQEMKLWFEKRTNKHINLVQKYAKKIEEAYPKRFKGLIDQTEDHDASKLKEPERTPYIYITWQYKMKDQGKDYKIPEGIDGNEATMHHILHNQHHPEYHQEEEVDLLNREDRDEVPDKIVDATKMSDLDICEMVSDWLAMSEEKDSNPKDWANKNINKRWKFTDDQKDLIYEIIDEIEVD